MWPIRVQHAHGRSALAPAQSQPIMSSMRFQTRGHLYFRILPVVLTFVLALAIGLTISQEADGAKKAKSSATAKKKLPVITGVDPLKGIPINGQLKIKGKNFVKGKNKIVVIFQRFGSKRRFSSRGTATSTKAATVRVPDVSGDMIAEQEGRDMLPTDNMFRLRVVTKFGASKKLTSQSLSPVVSWSKILNDEETRGPEGDCDFDKVKNKDDTDDDNDLLPDSTELAIATDVCERDTDLDGMSDYYEYRVAYEYNSGPALVIPYPSLRPYPNPLVADGNIDYDGDSMIALHEYQAWQYTGSMARFYSDANQDSDGDTIVDGAEDEDSDLLPNLAEIQAFQGGSPARELDFLKTDTDGDTLCDGLDDQDHDGPPTPLNQADCSTPVPNNGVGGNPSSPVGAGDPNPGLIDGDDNRYSNYYEWMIEGADPLSADWAYDPCIPSIYPISPYCEAPFNPF